ncbi:hypothetical protein GFK91_31040 (plasmid) [Roseibium aggregatum]|nr:hypothetical protein GFK91_31040 [Roseibium aggregatum]
MVPARSSRHGISCSRHLSRSQAEVPLILAVQISRASSMARTVHAVVNHGEPYRPFFEGVSPGGRTSL